MARHSLIFCTVSSIFTAELCAIYHALLFIQHQTWNCYLICTDSLSALRSLSGYTVDHPIIIEILTQVSHLNKAGKSVVFCWVPSHVGLPGNKATDTAAKSAAYHGTLASSRALGCGVPSFICLTVLASWHDEWDRTQLYKLRMLMPSVHAQHSCSSARKEEVMPTCLQVGHIHLTLGHLLHGELALVCIYCGVPLSVSHILVYCLCYSKVHLYYLHGMLPDMLGDDRRSV